MTVSRRQLIGSSAAVGAGMALGSAAGASSAEAAPAASPTGTGLKPGTGRLFPPLQHAPGDLLALPAGFSYRVLGASGRTDLDGGLGKTPDRPDGTGCFASGSGLRLVQNHEISPTRGAEYPVPLVKGTVYDPAFTAGSGGCTVIETSASGRRRGEWVGLSGTANNCAGGVTPWGSWLSCEETEDKAGTSGNGITYEKDHGYVFEVLPSGPGTQVPRPIKAWGRFAHEAVVVAPDRRTVYLTEDSSTPNGLFYRWSAPEGMRLGAGLADRLGASSGRLQAMVVLASDGSVLPDLSYVTSAQIGRPWKVRWAHVPDRSAATASVRTQFADGTVTRSKKLEGAWGNRQGVFFAASFAIGLGTDVPAGAVQHDGQIWFYDYAAETLTLLAYFPYDAAQHDGSGTGSVRYPDLVFDGPDNVHVSPYGTLVLAEDGENYQHLLSFTPRTGTQAIVRNLIPFEGGFAEMTGPTFSPDGSVLFGNVQEPGHTFAIHGPWARYLG
jgi:secreted PhoX family phosphatase